MITDIEFDPAARREVDDAKLWHDQQQPGLGSEFADDLARSIRQAFQTPERFPKYLFGTRRCLLSRFKYLIVFVVEKDRLIVVAVFHGSRRPGYWRKRLK